MSQAKAESVQEQEALICSPTMNRLHLYHPYPSSRSFGQGFGGLKHFSGFYLSGRSHASALGFDVDDGEDAASGRDLRLGVVGDRGKGVEVRQLAARIALGECDCVSLPEPWCRGRR
jgi:hypothetical protein